MLVSPCGIICNECPYYNNECKGCKNIDGKVFWAADITGNGKCPMYSCAIDDKKLSNCGKCSDLPCQLYYDTKDPDSTEEQHQETILKRVAVLRVNNLR
jgi:hypothetical protein